MSDYDEEFDEGLGDEELRLEDDEHDLDWSEEGEGDGEELDLEDD